MGNEATLIIAIVLVLSGLGFLQFIYLRFEINSIHDKLKEKPKEEKPPCIWDDSLELPRLLHKHYQFMQKKEDSSKASDEVKEKIKEIEENINKMMKDFEDEYKFQIIKSNINRISVSDVRPSIPSIEILIR